MAVLITPSSRTSPRYIPGQFSGVATFPSLSSAITPPAPSSPRSASTTDRAAFCTDSSRYCIRHQHNTGTLSALTVTGKRTHIAIARSAHSHGMRFAPPRSGQPSSPPRPRCLPLLRPEASSEVRRVADATRKLVRAAAGRCARRYAAAHVERDGADGAHRHHVQRRLALIATFAPALTLTLTLTRYFVLGQAEPAPMLPPARGRVKIRRVDKREIAEVLRWSSGKECVPRAGRGEVELACELRGIARSGKEG